MSLKSFCRSPVNSAFNQNTSTIILSKVRNICPDQKWHAEKISRKCNLTSINYIKCNAIATFGFALFCCKLINFFIGKKLITNPDQILSWIITWNRYVFATFTLPWNPSLTIYIFFPYCGLKEVIPLFTVITVDSWILIVTK